MKKEKLKILLAVASIATTSMAGLTSAVAGEVRNGKLPGKQQGRQPAVAVKPVKELAQTQDSTNASISLLEYYANLTTFDPSIELCAELNNIAIATGHNPVRGCNQQVTGNSGTTGSTGPSDSSPYIPPPGPAPVVFVHGFAPNSHHNCAEGYWQAQKDAVFKQDATRESITVGWYGDNEDCDVQLSTDSNYNNQRSLSAVAEDLYQWIDTRFGEQTIDIVAHSMGGLVVRKMLTEYGDYLRVSNVVTLGTPHAGVTAGHVGPVCAIFKQCRQAGHGSQFMGSLADNPQSLVSTQWTLIGAAKDGTIGTDTATNMSDGTGGPSVSTFEYKDRHKHTCLPWIDVIGHGDLHAANGSKTVRVCNTWSPTGNTVPNPTRRILDAID